MNKRECKGSSTWNKLFKKMWIIYYHMYFATKAISVEYDVIKTETIRRLRKHTLGLRMVRCLRNRISKRGDGIPDRMMRKVSFSWITTTLLTKDIYETRAKHIVYQFLQHTAVNFTTQNWFINYFLIIKKVQDIWKKYK